MEVAAPVVLAKAWSKTGPCATQALFLELLFWVLNGLQIYCQPDNM
jgi:hypothetical protein